MSSSSVPASVAGYLVQLPRALFRLAAAPSPKDVVGIETLDDVSVITSEAAKLYEQDKLTLAINGSPLTNRSESIWSTLKIWTDAWGIPAHIMPLVRIIQLRIRIPLICPELLMIIHRTGDLIPIPKIIGFEIQDIIN
jgi:hypothetical protein